MRIFSKIIKNSGIWLAGYGFMFLAACLIVAAHPAKAGTVANPCTGFGTTQISLDPTLPAQFFPDSQINADCVAWAQFIYLNWKAENPDAPSVPDAGTASTDFGIAGNGFPAVWQTYTIADTLFGASAGKSAKSGELTLFATSKLGDLDLSAITQASATAEHPDWLTDQRGGLTFYAVSINQDEEEYITKNTYDLTTVAGQEACATAKGGFILPSNQDTTDCDGNSKTFGLGNGSIELKSSWVILPTDHSLDYRYLTATAKIIYPEGSGKTTTETKTVGLVGLHIIRRMKGADQFVWSTFEQVDNNPDSNGSINLPANPNRKASPGYTYYNPDCDPETDYYKCEPNKRPDAGDPYDKPMQITRLTPVEDTANLTNQYAWSLFPAESVFNYYRLIDVQWPNQTTTILPQRRIPLTTGDITPSSTTRIVANTTMETYVQDSKSCMDCHRSADIAQKGSVSSMMFHGTKTRRIALFPSDVKLTDSDTDDNPYATTYSFIFSADTDPSK